MDDGERGVCFVVWGDEILGNPTFYEKDHVERCLLHTITQCDDRHIESGIEDRNRLLFSPPGQLPIHPLQMKF